MIPQRQVPGYIPPTFLKMSIYLLFNVSVRLKLDFLATYLSPFISLNPMESANSMFIWSFIAKYSNSSALIREFVLTMSASISSRKTTLIIEVLTKYPYSAVRHMITKTNDQNYKCRNAVHMSQSLIGIIGSGKMAAEHCLAIKKLPHLFQIAGVYSLTQVNRAKFAKIHNITEFPSLTALVKKSDLIDLNQTFLFKLIFWIFFKNYLFWYIS